MDAAHVSNKAAPVSHVGALARPLDIGVFHSIV